MKSAHGRDDAAADWVLCPACLIPLYGKRFARDLGVCGECGRHTPITAEQRAGQLADEGRFEPLPVAATDDDPLTFTDTKSYRDRLAAARARTGMHDAVLCALAAIEGRPVVIAAMDFRFLGGSLGIAVGEMITAAAETALVRRIPLIIVTASGGARMQEGPLSLMQMAKTSAALEQLDRAGILTVSVITDPTYGGVAASFATLSDVLIAEPGARLGFAGRRVIEQTIRQDLPPKFQTAEFLLERGLIDMIVPRAGLRQALGALLRAAGPVDPAEPLVPADAGVITDPARVPATDPWTQVRRARAPQRPTALDYFALAFDEFRELCGDRISGDCAAVVGGTAWLGGRPVMVIGHQKGHDPKELMERNFGMPTPAGYRKAARLMRLAEKLGLPVITLIDTPGAYPGATAEEQGQAIVIAENIRLMSALRVPVISVVIGEGGSGGALALGVANRVLMFANGTYSVISSEGCAAIVWNDPAAAPLAAAALALTARDLLRLGVVDAVLPEPGDDVGAAPVAAAEQLHRALVATLGELAGRSGAELADERRARFRRFGARQQVLVRSVA
ncbi:acetyl-CoA carboxylase carboxyl transferase subunit alpha [Nocardia gipuzkoensis]|uniref:acetyl-CoA carboxylase carboxyl transferase subunit alpha n=1 Tax=Nocardia gipuzkoensis TaxID=2749991 RepID=UPI001E3BBE00|nr:acetyl-CoA carboxylase carboxyl transferase subunit alpha [Nocardia gipuzkoensis]UGT72310.1 acetyl-CoA carboxylase carboxyl transferase subunit alpha [Nocardia gipuzkoensis]